MRHTITLGLLCVCLMAVAGCKKGSEPVGQPQTVKQTISMEQPAPNQAGEQTTPSAGTEKTVSKPEPAAAPEQAAQSAESAQVVSTPAKPPMPAASETEPAEPAVDAASAMPEAGMEEGAVPEEVVGEGEEASPVDGEVPAEPELVINMMDVEADASSTDGVDQAKAEEEALFSPFTPLFQKDEKNDDMAVEQEPGQKRAFLTPLERISLGQLQLSGIIRATSGNRAIVTDATGKGYVIKQGTYIGLNSGRVEEIVEDRVLVVEMIGGRRAVTELKLQKPAGE